MFYLRIQFRRRIFLPKYNKLRRCTGSNSYAGGMKTNRQTIWQHKAGASSPKDNVMINTEEKRETALAILMQIAQDVTIEPRWRIEALATLLSSLPEPENDNSWPPTLSSELLARLETK
jgi:hypothetical protein